MYPLISCDLKLLISCTSYAQHRVPRWSEIARDLGRLSYWVSRWRNFQRSWFSESFEYPSSEIGLVKCLDQVLGGLCGADTFMVAAVFGGASLASSAALPGSCSIRAEGLGSKCYLVYWDALVFLGIVLGWNGKRAEFPLETQSVIVKRKTRKKDLPEISQPYLQWSGNRSAKAVTDLHAVRLRTQEWCLCCVLNLQTSSLREMSN